MLKNLLTNKDANIFGTIQLMKIKDTLLESGKQKEYELTTHPPTTVTISGSLDPASGLYTSMSTAGTYIGGTTAPSYPTYGTTYGTTGTTTEIDISDVDDAIKLMDKVRLDTLEDVMDDLEACETTDEYINVIAKLQKKIKRLKRDKV